MPGLSSKKLTRTVLLSQLAICTLFGTQAFPGENEALLWEALRSEGHFALLRHALAPGVGDPPDFTLGDCETQRNLSAEGRRQAVRIGERLRANGIHDARVYSSQWCRCLETAELLALGPVQELPVLNSFFRRGDQRQEQTRMLRDWVAEQDLDRPLVLVTHQVNITAFTDVYPGSGELAIVHRSSTGDISVVGTIRMD